MRHLVALATVLSLAACATQEPAPMPAPAPAAAAKPAAKPIQCWHGDKSMFMDVGTKTSIAGVAVECKPTADGKAAQWMGSKH